MVAYTIRRLLQAFALIFVVATLVALFIHAIPGDPVYVILGENNVTPERVAAVRRDLGLDRPVPVQYAEWIGAVARGDFGKSLISGRPIRGDLALRLPRTLELVLVSTLLSVLVGVPLGVVAATNRNKLPDLAVSTLTLIGVSAPVFVVGTLLVLVIGVQWGILPAAGYVPFRENPIEHIQHLILPCVALATLETAILQRMTRSSMLEVLAEDYVRTARAKGLAGRVVVYGHALRNALIPVLTIIGVQIGSALGGTVLVELIFNWPGLSSYLVTGINQRDYPVVQAVVLLIAALFILLNLLTDLCYAVVDPRIRYG
jgi:peptide/nickel transport system permease protein